MWVPTSTPKTAEGFDMTFGTNHLGHFLLTDLLLPLIKKAAATENSRPRIINLSSCAHFSGRINEESLAAYLTTLQVGEFFIKKFVSPSLARFHLTACKICHIFPNTRVAPNKNLHNL